MIQYQIPISFGGERTLFTDGIFTTGDKRAYRLLFSFYEGAKRFDAADYALVIKAKRADGSVVEDRGTITAEGEAYYDVASAVYSVPGELSMEVALISEDGGYITTKELMFTVREGYGEGESFQEDAAPILTKLVLAANRAELAVSQMQKTAENCLHPAGFLFEETEGLTDADTFPDNTIYTITQTANVVNLPDHTGTLITFGSTNSNSGATQIFMSYTGIMYVRWKQSRAYKAWTRLSDDNRIQTFINSNNNSTVAMKTGVLITTVQEAPLDDANTYPANTIYSFAGGSTILVKNLPSQNGTLMTFNYKNNVTVCTCQLFVTNHGAMYNRINWSNTWTAWKMLATEGNVNNAISTCKAYADEMKKNHVDEYVSLSMFEKFGVIGESYSSGAIYVLNEDGSQKSAGSYYNLSWGQMMARKLGTTCTNFSKGGLSTRTWLTDDKGLPLLLSTEPQNIYYLMLGINDKTKHGAEYIGTMSDIQEDYTQNADTFYGNYGKIISHIKAHAPNAKIIMSTMTGKTGTNKQFNDAIEAIAAHFGIPCVKQYENDFFNSDFYRNNIVVDHPTAPVYAGMANALQKMFETAVRDNVAYFNDYIG